MEMFFLSSGIYKVNPEDGCLDYRSGEVELVDVDMGPGGLRLPFWVTGIMRHDLAIFGSSVDSGGVEGHGLLVISSSQGQGQVASPEVIENFEPLWTAELAKKLATLREEELAQLGVDGLVCKIRSRYPGIKSLHK